VVVRDLLCVLRVLVVVVVRDVVLLVVVGDDDVDVDAAVVVPSVCVTAEEVVDVEDDGPPPPHPATTPATSAQRVRAHRRDTHRSLARPTPTALQAGERGPAAQSADAARGCAQARAGRRPNRVAGSAGARHARKCGWGSPEAPPPIPVHTSPLNYYVPEHRVEPGRRDTPNHRDGPSAHAGAFPGWAPEGPRGRVGDRSGRAA
jgi:hypothetical protein